MANRMPRVTINAAVLSALLAIGATVSGCNDNTPTPELLKEAQQYQAKGDQKAALIQLKNAVAQSPDNGEARARLGALALEMGDLPSADKELRKAASLGIPAARTQPLLARAMLEQGQFKELLDQITPEAAKASAPLLARRGDAFLALGDAAHAKESYEQALAVDANSGDALVGLARHALTQRDRDGAQRYAAEAVAKDPRNAEAWLFQGSMLRAANKPDEALAAFDKVLALKPTHRTAHVEKASLDIARGKYDAAQAELDVAAKSTPGNMLVTYTQGLLDFSRGKFKVAQESVQKVLKSAPGHVPTLLLAGAVELNLGATQQAEQHLRKVLEVAPTNIYARKLLAQTLLKNAQPADAAEALAPALTHPTKDAQLLALAGESYLQSRQFAKASDYFEQAAEIAPKAAVVHTSLGLSRLNQGEQDKAIRELELATTLDPKSSRAGFALVQAQLSARQFDKALASVEDMAKRQPDNAEVQNLKGGVCAAKGDSACARAAFERAAALKASYFAPVANLAELDVHDKKPEAARARFTAFLHKNPNNYGAMAGLADLALMQGKPDEATTWLEKANSANPDALVPALKLGQHYLRMRQPNKALVLARKYQTANPANPNMLELLGESQLATNDQAGALETYSKLVNVLPKSARAQMLLANVHALMKRNDEAADDLKHAVELAPDLPEARIAQAQLAMRSGKPDAALAVARATQQRPRLAMLGHMMEGDLQLGQKKPALALAAYEKAYAVTPTPQLLLKVASTMKLAGRAADADKVVAQWRKAHPDEPAVALYAAEAHLANKELKPAIALLEGVLKHEPNNPVALNNLAWAYQQAGDARALATAEQAFKLTGNSPAVMDTLGWLLVEQGNTGRGVPLLQQAATLAPRDGDIRYHLAAGLSRAGDKAAAKKELDKLFAENVQFTQLDAARSLRSTL